MSHIHPIARLVSRPHHSSCVMLFDKVQAVLRADSQLHHAWLFPADSLVGRLDSQGNVHKLASPLFKDKVRPFGAVCQVGIRSSR